jgi:hypothetical protein
VVPVEFVERSGGEEIADTSVQIKYRSHFDSESE